MKIVFDANVILSAFISHGISNDIFNHCLKKHSLFTSHFILDELLNKLLKRFSLSSTFAQMTLNFVSKNSTLVTPMSLPKAVCRDPDDDMILATGFAADANCIISGDKDLTDLKIVRGIPIFSPSHFWSFEKSRFSQP